MKNVRKIVMVIIGTLIGAGFASGREIYDFFLKFGQNGILGILISSIITGLIIFFTLEISKNNNIRNYDDFLEKINYKYKKINKIIKLIIILFLLISFFIMVAGFSAYIKQVYNIEIYISSTCFVVIVYLVLRKRAKGMLKYNNILVPIIISLIYFLGIKNINDLINIISNISTKNILLFDSKNNNWFLYAILYTSYNSIILIPTLITIKEQIKNKKEILLISLIATIIILLLAFCIFGLLLKSEINIDNIDMPVVEVLDNNNLKFIYGIIIIISIFTSTISVGNSFLENISDEKSYNRNLIIICICSVFVSNIGFSYLVSLLYPIFGILGILPIYFIYKNSLEKKAKECYKLCNNKCRRIK